MTYIFDNRNYILRFEKGEEFVSALTDFVKEQNIKGGWIAGLGGLAWAELGFYDLDARQYRWRKVNLALELTSLTGNIAWSDGNPALHLHASVSDAGLQTYGGHLRSAEIAGTVEVFIQILNEGKQLHRKIDEETGLNLLDI